MGKIRHSWEKLDPKGYKTKCRYCGLEKYYDDRLGMTIYSNGVRITYSCPRCVLPVNVLKTNY